MNVSDIAARLAEHAEAVCRRYLSNGRREGAYWRVGDIANTPGRSLFVGLASPMAGRWSDAATGAHGDLVDLIVAQTGGGLVEALAEARGFLALPREAPRAPAAARTSPQAARRLFATAAPIASLSPAGLYLRRRGLDGSRAEPWLRFHPDCYYRVDGERRTGPALLAAATDLKGAVQGLQRLWLTQDGRKAPLAAPRRAMGQLAGHAVRIGTADDVLLAGEGLETVLSPLQVLPALPAAAALSAGNLGALVLPAQVQRLYIAADNDPAGQAAAERLGARAAAQAIEVVRLVPECGDFNDDLVALGPARLARGLRAQLLQADWARFAAPGG